MTGGRLALVALLAGVVIAVATTVGHSGPRPGTEPGGADWHWAIRSLEVDAYALNDSGQMLVIGSAPGAPTLWSDGHTVALLPRGKHGEALALDDSGRVVGWYDNLEGCEAEQCAFLWQRGKVSNLPVAGEVNLATDVNGRGQVVGIAADWSADDYSYLATESPPTAVIWEKGRSAALATPAGGASSAHAINERGEVVGWSREATSEWHATLWRNGVAIDLGTLPGHSVSDALAVNDAGQVVGISSGETGAVPTDAFLWQNGRMTALADRGTISRADDINDRGQVVGTTDAMSVRPHAFLWERGKLTDLGTLPGDDVSGATAINDRGQILGWSGSGSKGTAVLWTLERGP